MALALRIEQVPARSPSGDAITCAAAGAGLILAFTCRETALRFVNLACRPLRGRFVEDAATRLAWAALVGAAAVGWMVGFTAGVRALAGFVLRLG